VNAVIAGGVRAAPARPGILLAALVFVVIVDASAQAPWRVDPPEWSFGPISDSEPVHRDVVVENRGSERLRVAFILTCDCLYAEPSEAAIRPGGKAVFRLHFDPAGYEGRVEKDLIVRFQGRSADKGLFRVFGEVQKEAGGSLAEAAMDLPAGEGGDSYRVDYYYSPGCAGCERFLADEVPAIEAGLGLSIEVRRRNIFDPAVYEEYQAVLGTLAEEERAYPAVLIGTTLLQGEGEVESGFRDALRRVASSEEKAETDGADPGREPPAGPPGREKKGIDLAILPVLAAGLLDGVNPCAFATLLFLLSALAVAGKGRKDVLLIGLVFALSVFTSYLLIGVGFFQAVRLASSFALAASVIKWLLVATLLAFAVLSLYDFHLIRRGRTANILLQLPSSFKRRIHDSVRARSSAIVGGTLVLGFLVSVFELACTGQVYLPTIVYLVRTDGRLAGYLYLALYNLGFIVPLLGVFGLSYAGLSSQKLTRIFRGSIAAVKLGLALLFLTLAALTLFTP
jgi:cytochrome c biogenesis protein CcdA